MRRRTRKNTFFILFLCIFIGGYFLLFSSNIWFPDKAQLIQATKLNQKKEWKNREFTLLDWTYCESMHKMEIKIEILNKAMDGSNDYGYEAMERRDGFLQVTPIVEEDDFLVLQIENIRSWKEISLRIYLKDEETENVKFYTNITSVKNVAEIERKTENQYQTERIDEKIAFYEADIVSLTEKLDEMEQIVLSQERDIAEMKKKEAFQTEEQKREMESLIQNAESVKNTTVREIQEAKQQMEEYKNRIDNLKKERVLYES